MPKSGSLWVTIGLLLLGLLVACAGGQEERRVQLLQNGMYLLTWRGTDAEEVPPPKDHERLLEFKYQFLDPSSHRHHEYVVVDTRQRVPFELAEDPSEYRSKHCDHHW